MVIPVKAYIKVMGTFEIDGSFTPTKIEWEDGSLYDVEKVVRFAPRASSCGGGPTMRYEVKIWGQTKYLFRETDTDKWFVEVMPHH